MDIRPVGAELFRADGQTDMTKLTVALRNSANAPKNKDGYFYIHGSVRRESNLITAQQDATYSVYYISVGSSTCFGC